MAARTPSFKRLITRLASYFSTFETTLAYWRGQVKVVLLDIASQASREHRANMAVKAPFSFSRRVDFLHMCATSASGAGSCPPWRAALRDHALGFAVVSVRASRPSPAERGKLGASLSRRRRLGSGAEEVR